MREKLDKENQEIKPHLPTAEEKETEEKVAALLNSGGEIVKYNHWLPEQCFLTEIKLGEETHIFKTAIPLPITKTTPSPPNPEKPPTSSAEKAD